MDEAAAEEQYEEELTAAEVLQKLEDAWLNEKHAPELLESKIEIVECMLDQVRTMEEKHQTMKKSLAQVTQALQTISKSWASNEATVQAVLQEENQE